MLCVPGTAPISPMPPFLCSDGFFPFLKEIVALQAVWSDFKFLSRLFYSHRQYVFCLIHRLQSPAE